MYPTGLRVFGKTTDAIRDEQNVIFTERYTYFYSDAYYRFFVVMAFRLCIRRRENQRKRRTLEVCRR